MCKFRDARLLDVLIMGSKMDKLANFTFSNSC